MTRFQALLLRAKARHQTQRVMRKYRARVWWNLDLWVA